jgi:FolB domain-containing protein
VKPLEQELKINGLKVAFVLGNNKSEKLVKRSVIFNFTLRFGYDNKACYSDGLNDTVCYSGLAKAIRLGFEGKSFNLIEHAAQFAYQVAGEYLCNTNILKRVEVVKIFPELSELQSASFIYSDW